VDSELAYDSDGRLRVERSNGVPEHPVQSNTVEDKLLTFVCGNESGAVALPPGSVTVTTADSFYAHHPAEVAKVVAGSKPNTTPSRSAGDSAQLGVFLDRTGGYRDKSGGYYNPTAGTYADGKGGTVDNWQGYTYSDGSYKSKNGDYYDAPKSTIHLASGDMFMKPDSMTSAEAIRTLRANVQETGGYDKDYVRKSMMAVIRQEHPAALAH
jgi:hypothetical protein